MNQQLLLPECAPAPQQIYRLILMSLLPAAISNSGAHLASALKAKHGLEGRPLRTNRFHLTLHGLGEFTAVPPEILETVNPVEAEFAFPPFEVTFDRVVSFSINRNRYPVALIGSNGFSSLQHFYRILGDSLSEAAAGSYRFPAKFNPHVTLLYDRQRIQDQKVEPVSWTITEFSLVLSVVGQTRYVHLKRWRLTG